MENIRNWFIVTDGDKKIYVGSAPDARTLMTTLNRRDALAGQAFIMYAEGVGWFYWPKGNLAYNDGAGEEYRGELTSEPQSDDDRV